MIADSRIGSIIAFGPYKWRILDRRQDRMLIISEGMVTQLPFNDRAGGVTWADSFIRRYLNQEFYHQFSETEKVKILSIMNKNHNNQWYNSDGGKDTEDYIFLLSIEEVICKYFGDSRKNLENPSPKQRYWFQRKDENNVKRQARLHDQSWWWWLRSPGRDNKRAVYIHGDGNIGIQGNGTYRYSSKTIHPLTGENHGGVRPALWLKIL